MIVICGSWFNSYSHWSWSRIGLMFNITRHLHQVCSNKTN